MRTWLISAWVDCFAAGSNTGLFPHVSEVTRHESQRCYEALDRTSSVLTNEQRRNRA